MHGQAAALVHLVLLELDAAQLVLQLATFRHRACVTAALTRVNLKQRPDAPAHIAAALDFHRALRTVGKKVLKEGGRRNSLVSTASPAWDHS